MEISLQNRWLCNNNYADSLEQLPKRDVQAEINADLFHLLTNKHWSYDSKPQGLDNVPQDALAVDVGTAPFQKQNQRNLCSTSTTLGASWDSDFAKLSRTKPLPGEPQKDQDTYKPQFPSFDMIFSSRKANKIKSAEELFKNDHEE